MRLATKASCDGHSGLVLLVAAGVGIVGDDRGDPARRRALGGVDHYQQFHDVIVDGVGDGLNEKDVLLADVLQYPDEGIVIAKLEHLALSKRNVQVAADVLRQLAVCVAAKHF